MNKAIVFLLSKIGKKLKQKQKKCKQPMLVKIVDTIPVYVFFRGI